MQSALQLIVIFSWDFPLFAAGSRSGAFPSLPSYTSYTPPRLFHLSRTLAAGTTAVSYPTYIPVNSIFVTFLALLLSSFTLGCTLTNELTGTVELPENSTINISGAIGEILLVNFVSIMHLSLTSVLFYVGQ